jgi:hypothetical protein
MGAALGRSKGGRREVQLVEDVGLLRKKRQAGKAAGWRLGDDDSPWKNKSRLVRSK